MKRILVTLVTLITLLLPCSGWSQGPDFTSEPGFLLASPTNISKQFRLQGDLSIIRNARFANGLGEVAVARTSLSADYSIFNLSYGLSDFTWNHPQAVTFSNGDRLPWRYLHDVTLNARLLNNVLTDNWHYWLNGTVTSSFEKIFPGAVGAGLDGGVAYDFWDGWMVGVSGRTVALSALSADLFGEVEFGLVLAVSQKTLRKTLREFGLIGEDAPKGSKRIGLNFIMSGSSKNYRLSSSSPVRRNGYLGIVRSKIGMYLDYSPNDHWVFSIGPEYNYGRSYKIYDSQGKLHSSHGLDDAMGGYMRMRYYF